MVQCMALTKKEQNRRYYEKNRERIIKQNGEYKKKNPQVGRKHHLKKNYGITPEDFDRMMEEQDGKCALCGVEPQSKALHVDHCHTTGKVRGLLCGGCNRVLGFLEARPGWHLAAQQYLHER